MAGRAALRASDADREHVAERLRKAAGEGRLRTEELEQRLETAFSSHTYGELDALLRDLPGRRLVVPSQPSALGFGRTAFAFALAATATIAVAMVVLFLVTGVFAGWLLWILAGWLFFGRRRYAMGRCGARHPGAPLGGGRWSASRSPRYWA